jgi:hypothetical protein
MYLRNKIKKSKNYACTHSGEHWESKFLLVAWIFIRDDFAVFVKLLYPHLHHLAVKVLPEAKRIAEALVRAIVAANLDKWFAAEKV